VLGTHKHDASVPAKHPGVPIGRVRHIPEPHVLVTIRAPEALFTSSMKTTMVCIVLGPIKPQRAGGKAMSDDEVWGDPSAEWKPVQFDKSAATKNKETVAIQVRFRSDPRIDTITQDVLFTSAFENVVWTARVETTFDEALICTVEFRLSARAGLEDVTFNPKHVAHVMISDVSNDAGDDWFGGGDSKQGWTTPIKLKPQDYFLPSPSLLNTVVSTLQSFWSSEAPPMDPEAAQIVKAFVRNVVAPAFVQKYMPGGVWIFTEPKPVDESPSEENGVEMHGDQIKIEQAIRSLPVTGETGLVFGDADAFRLANVLVASVMVKSLVA
jgi:hypothetical protein